MVNVLGPRVAATLFCSSLGIYSVAGCEEDPNYHAAFD